MAVGALSRPATGGLSRRRLRRNVEGWLFVAPVMFGVLAFYFIPILVSLYTSFTNSDGLTPPSLIGLDNYERLLTRD